MRDSKTEREIEVYETFEARDEVRHLGASESHCIKSTCSVIISLPCHIDREKVISGANLSWPRLLI